MNLILQTKKGKFLKSLKLYHGILNHTCNLEIKSNELSKFQNIEILTLVVKLS